MSGYVGRIGRLVVMIAVIATLMTPIAASPAAAMVTADRQLVLTIDGSQSISAADWRLQKDGINAALQDRVAFPRNSSVAVGVIQFSGNTARIEVPLTVVDTTATVDALRAQVDAIVQLRNGTNPGDGVRAAADQLIAEGDSAGEWLICQSTDGTRNRGQTLASAATFAETSGVDRYSVIAIEDGGFDRAAAIAEYGPHVFGGGTVTVARNASEFATLLTGACLNAPLEVVAIEVNQAIQSWDLSVPLIQNKLSVVRAFVQTTDGSTVSTSALLFGTRADGSVLPGSPLAPINAGGDIAASDDVTARRADRGASLNFSLPRSWMQGDATVRLELPGGAICMETAPPANTCEVAIAPIATNELALRPIAVTYNDGVSDITPTNGQLSEQALRTWTQFPVGTISIDSGSLGEIFTGAPSVSDVTDKLADMRDDECALGVCDESAYWYGVLAGSAGGGVAEGIPGRVSTGYMGGQGSKNDEGYARNRGPHEVAHTLGASHAVDGDLGLINQTLWFFGGNKQGYCGEVGAKDAPDFPYIETIGSTTVPTLGPLGDPQTEIWGFDNRFARGVEDLSVVDPNETLPLMSYGNGNECNLATDGQFRWISEFNYGNLISVLAAPAPDAVGGGGGGGGGGSWDALFISGTIDFATETTTFRNARVLPSGRVDFATTGDYSLDVFAADGSLLVTKQFEPILVEGDQPYNETVRGWFNVPVELTDVPVASVGVRFEETPLGQLAASSNAPTVQITAPAAGAEITDDVVTIAWTGGDADGDAITYSVYYTPDGVSWRGLASNTAAMSIDVARDQLTASNTGQLVVVASDGINSMRGELDLVIIGNNAPDVSIVGPSESESFSGVQSILFDGVATDREDGSLPEASVTWSSDLDGVLGTGEQVVVQASDLAAGRHVITLTATDSQGLTAAASVNIEIFRIAPPEEEPPVEPVDARPIAICRDGQGVVEIGLTNSESTAAVYSLTVGSLGSQVQIAAGGSAALRVVGLDDGTYEATVRRAGVIIMAAESVSLNCGNHPGPTPAPTPQATPVGPEVMHVVSCLGGNGRVDTNIVNTGSSAATYRLEFEGLSARQTTVAAGDWWRMPITGRPDRAFDVVVSRNGIEVSATTVTISCDTAPPVVDETEVRVVNACRDSRGYVLFQFVNDTAPTASYVISFAGVPNRSTSVVGYGQSLRAVTGRPNGAYAATIRRNGQIIATEQIVVRC